MSTSKPRLRNQLYNAALRLYPKAYRDRFTKEMKQALSDQLMHSRATDSSRIWGRAFAELPTSLFYEHVSNVKEMIMAHPVEVQFSRRNLMIGLVSIVPIVTILSGLIIFHQLYPGQNINSTAVGHYFYARQSAYIFGFTLPLIGLFFNLLPVLRQLEKNHWQLFDLKSYRLSLANIAFLVVAGGFVTLLFGHDSFHCVMRNPLHLIQHRDDVITCLRTSG